METSQIVAQIDAEIARLQQVRQILAGMTTEGPVKRGRGRPRKTTLPVLPKKRTLSAEARAKIAAATKARWAQAKKAGKTL